MLESESSLHIIRKCASFCFKLLAVAESIFPSLALEESMDHLQNLQPVNLPLSTELQQKHPYRCGMRCIFFNLRNFCRNHCFAEGSKDTFAVANLACACRNCTT